MASEAFEISSRRKISLLLYRECTIRSRIWTTSAWKLKLSCSVCALTAGTLDQIAGRGKPVGGHAPGPFGPKIVPNGLGVSLTGCHGRSRRVFAGEWPSRDHRP